MEAQHIIKKCEHAVETWTYVDDSDTGCQGVCTKCGDFWTMDTFEHNFVDGVCEDCGYSK